MRINDIALLEAKAKICPKCGNKMTGFHYWYKGEWRCKKSQKDDAQEQPADQAHPEERSPEAPATAKPTAQPKAAAPTSLKAKIQRWLKEHDIENSNIRDDNTVDVDGDVFIYDINYAVLPVKFGKVTGDFEITGGSLKSLRNFPSEVGGDCVIADNEVTSLEGVPAKIGGSLDCSSNPLETIELTYGIEIGDSFILHAGNKLSVNKITSLANIHKTIKRAEMVVVQNLKITEAVLGVMLIRDIKEVNFYDSKVTDIINKHLKEPDPDVLACQDELIEAGYASYAKIK